MNKWIQNERGIALVMVLLIITLFSIMGLSLMSLSINNVKMSAHEREHESAYYISEAGLTTALKKVEETALKVKAEFDQKPEATLAEFYAALEAEILSPGIVYPSPDFDVAYGEKPVATVTVLKSADGVAGKYTIKSTGVIGSQKRTSSRTLQINNVPGLKFAVFSRTAELSAGTSISGNLGVSSTAAGSVNFVAGNPQVTGSIYVPRGSESIAVTGKNTRPVLPYDGEVKVALPPFPEYPNTYKSYEKSKITTEKNTINVLDMTNDSYTLTELNVGNDTTLTINTGTTNKGLVIDKLIMSKGKIDIVGTGNLTIYVRKSMTLTSSSEINFNSNTAEDSTKLIIYLQQSSDMPTLSIDGSNKIHGSLYAQTADVKLGGNGVFEGHIFTGGTSVEVVNSAEAGTDKFPSLFYAPNARFNLANGADIQGLVVANQFVGTGGKMTPRDIQYSSLPYQVAPVKPTLKDEFIVKEPIREMD